MIPSGRTLPEIAEEGVADAGASAEIAALRGRLEVLESFDRAQGLSGLVNAAQAGLRKPVAYIDLGHRLVAGAPREHRQWPDLRRVLAACHAASSVAIGAAPLIAPAGPTTGLAHRVLVTPVGIGEEHVGWCLVVERPGRLDETDGYILRALARRLGLELRTQQRIARVAFDARATLARQLARGTATLDDLRASGEYLGVDVDASRVVVHVLDGSPEASAPGAEPVDPGLIAADIRRATATDVLAARGNEGVLLMVEAPEGVPGHEVTVRVRRAVEMALAQRCGPAAVAGVSDVAEPGHFMRAYRDARDVAHSVRRWGGAGRRVLSVGDLGPARLFLANSDIVALRRHVSATIGPLLEAESGDLLPTLQTWFDLGRSIRGTAQELGGPREHGAAAAEQGPDLDRTRHDQCERSTQRADGAARAAPAGSPCRGRASPGTDQPAKGRDDMSRTAPKALVTGAAREGSIGEAIVERLVADGMEVVTMDRRPGCTWQLDIARDPLPDLSDVDVYVGNAALTTVFGQAHTLDLAKWQLDLDVNLTGTFRVLQACLAGMRERGFGRVVLVSSTAGTVGLPGQVSYSTTKAGLLGMVKTVAAENVATGITANAVLPGMTASSGVLSMPADIVQAWRDSMPGGMVEPEDIADAVAYFASPRAGRVTGQILTVDAGDGLNTRSVTSSVVGSAP